MMRDRIQMYRVSSEISDNHLPCGSFYYFRKLANAMKAFEEFNSSIIPIMCSTDQPTNLTNAMIGMKAANN